MSYKITVDKVTCIGCGACTTCDNFELGEQEVDGEPKQVAHPKQADLEEAGCSQEAADICPVDAIKVSEE